ncbi:MAG: hypothetical protein QXP57_07170 [Nitrososphaerota archaeon]
MLKSRYRSFPLDHIVPLIIFLITFAVTWGFLGSRALPWWVDGGLWLKYAKAYLGITWPMWEEKTLNYPPLFPSILAVAIFLKLDPVIAVKLLATLVFSIRPAIAYISSIMIFGNRLTAFLTALMFMFLPIHVEMLGWGGYPNLLTLSFMNISMSLLVSWLNKGFSKTVAFLLLFSIIIAIGHNITFLAYSSTLLLLLASSIFLKKPNIVKKTSLIASSSIGGYLIYSIIFLRSSQYVLNNEAAYYHLEPVISSGLLTWIFKSPILMFSLYFLFASTIVMSIFIKKRLLEVSVLVAWASAPILLLNMHKLGIALDYYRVFFFFVDPFIFLAAGSTSFLFDTLHTSISRIGKYDKLRELLRILLSIKFSGFAKIIILVVVVVSCCSSIFYGIQTFNNLNEWYNFRDKYGDREKLEAVKWIEENIPERVVIVAEEEIARWIEGLSSRRVLMLAHPMYLFVQGELERAYMAKTILLSSIALTNNLAALYEPRNPSENMSTRVALKAFGALEELLYLEANSSYVEGVSEAGYFRDFLSDAQKIEVLEKEDKLIIRYFLEHSIVEKTLSVTSNSAEVILSFKAEPLRNKVNIYKLAIELKMWPSITLWDVRAGTFGRLTLITSIGRFLIDTNSMTAMPFIFKTAHDNDSILGFIKISPDGEVENVGSVKVIRSADILKEVGGQYIVIPRIQHVKPHNRYISLEPITKHEYLHLLHDPAYIVVYQNERVIILKMVE